MLEQAKSIFLPGMSEQINIQAGFRKDFPVSESFSAARLKLTARSFYRVYLNGQFVFHGPARAGHGHARVDDIDISGFLRPGVNALAVEVAGYGDAYGYSNDISCEPGFLLAAVEIDGKTVCATDKTWKALRLTGRRDKADRYSHCREISELYDLDEAYFSWRTAPENELIAEPAEEINTELVLLTRGMPAPEFETVSPGIVEAGGIRKAPQDKILLNFYEAPMAEKIKALEERPSSECCFDIDGPLEGSFDYFGKSGAAVVLNEGVSQNGGAFVTADFGRMTAGFIGIEIELTPGAVVDLTHAERVEEDGSLCARPTSNNTLRLHAGLKKFCFLSFESYGFRYLKVTVRGCKRFTIKRLFALENAYPQTNAGSFLCSDETVNRLYNAAALTLRLCTLDIFMDCPDRERGGWLCDSFWTGRAAKLMLGDTAVEKAMLENFLHLAVEKQFHGFFPACYPALDKFENGTITTWSFWLVLELKEYAERSADTELIAKYRERIALLIDGANGFANKDGLLENLPGVFIDWSLSNRGEYTGPVSVPANALFACALDAAASLYARADWAEHAEKIRRKLKEYAVTGEPGGVDRVLADSLQPNGEGKYADRGFYSESGLYTSLWSGLFAHGEVPELLEHAADRFGPAPEKSPVRRDVGPANMFIGLCVRLDLLSRLGFFQKMFDELKALYLPMLKDGPGTLWESVGGRDSRCHGFNAHAGVLLTKDILGLYIADEREKRFSVAPHPCGLRWAKGTMLTQRGAVSLCWSAENNRFRLSLTKPEGYAAEIILPPETLALNEQNPSMAEKQGTGRYLVSAEKTAFSVILSK